MCELKYDKVFDPKTADWKKLRVKELRKICDDQGIDTKGLVISCPITVCSFPCM